ncbi:MAG: tetratricopeptide repeat protein [Verrucomicrobiota bacterium]|jgi:tetratricopeptide (TPR) repeat protein|nr:tetratricopeptide repeat protein [Verrucomicrobiota bacterium]
MLVWQRSTILFGVLVWCLLGCHRQEEGVPSADNVPDAPGWVAPQLPRADLSGVDPSVRNQFEIAERKAMALQAKVPVEPSAVGAVIGHLGMLYETYDYHQTAAECFEIAGGLDPKQFKWMYCLGLAHRSQGRTEDALHDFKRVMEMSPAFLPARIGAGQVCLDLDRHEEAKSLFEAVLKAQPDNPPALAGMGKVAYAAKEWKTAIAAFERALALQPEATALHYSLGLAYRGAGDLERAREHLDQRGKLDAFMRDPIYSEICSLRMGTRAHEHRGVNAGKGGDLKIAIQELEQAVTLDPQIASTRTNLGTAYALAGRLEDALEQYRAAIALDPQDRRGQCNCGMILAKLGCLDEGLACFAEALELDPDYCDAHIGYAAISGLLGDLEGAERHFRLAWKQDPQNRAALIGLVKALALLGKDMAAREVLEEGRKVHPQSLILAEALARLLATSRDSAVRDGGKAVELAAAVVQVRPTAQHWETLAMAFAEIGRFEEAVSMQQRALEYIRETIPVRVGEEGDEGRVRVAFSEFEDAQSRLVGYQAQQPCRDPRYRFDHFEGPIQSGRQ